MKITKRFSFVSKKHSSMPKSFEKRSEGSEKRQYMCQFLMRQYFLNFEKCYRDRINLLANHSNANHHA